MFNPESYEKAVEELQFYLDECDKFSSTFKKELSQDEMPSDYTIDCSKLYNAQKIPSEEEYNTRSGYKVYRKNLKTVRDIYNKWQPLYLDIEIQNGAKVETVWKRICCWIKKNFWKFLTISTITAILGLIVAIIRLLKETNNL